VEVLRTYTKNQIAAVLYIVSRRELDAKKPAWEQIDFKQEPTAGKEIETIARNLLDLSAKRARTLYGNEWTNITGKGRMGLALDTDHIQAVLDEAGDVLDQAVPNTKTGHLKRVGYNRNVLNRARQALCSGTGVNF
jgi:hypothetical protein